MFLYRALKKVIGKKRYIKKIDQYWDINSNYSFMLEDAICVSENFWQFDNLKNVLIIWQISLFAELITHPYNILGNGM